jgi:hypothetical protein
MRRSCAKLGNILRSDQFEICELLQLAKQLRNCGGRVPLMTNL